MKLSPLDSLVKLALHSFIREEDDNDDDADDNCGVDNELKKK